MWQNLCITAGDMLILASQFLKMVSMPTCSLILNFQVGFGGNCGNLHFNLDSYSSNYFIISACFFGYCICLSELSILLIQ